MVRFAVKWYESRVWETMNREPSHRLTYIGKLLHESLRLPVALIGPEGEIVREWGAAPLEHPLLGTQAEWLVRMAELGAGPGSLPVIQGTRYEENAILLRTEEANEGAWTVAIGPALYLTPASDAIQTLLEDNPVLRADRERWSAYYRGLTVVSRMQFVHAAMLAHLLARGAEIEPHDVVSHVHALDLREVRSEELQRELLARRENARLHHDPYLIERLHDCIRNGDKEGALRLFAEIPEESFGVLSKSSELRNRKNLAICTVTNATRCAMEGGMFSELAYTLSDLHILRIEELREVRQVEQAQREAVADFADRVREVREQRVSPTIAKCQNYIYDHLFEEISLPDLERVAGLNGGYLSQLFKKETGLSYRGYVAKRRIDEACKLIQYTDLTLTEIATRLCFHDQSHFTKAFKKIQGRTPKRYRFETTGR